MMFTATAGIHYNVDSDWEICAMGHVFRHIPFGLEFPNHTLDLIARLCERINIPHSQIDLTIASLAMVDKAAGKIYYTTDDDDEPELKGIPLELPPVEMIGEIIAFVGEVVIHAFDGRWCMEPVEGEEGVFEPYVKIKSGEFHFALKLAKMILGLAPRVNARHIYGEMYRVPKP